MAKISWLKVKNRLICVDQLEEIIIEKAFRGTPTTTVKAKITFAMKKRDIAVEYDSDEEAQQAFDAIWEIL